MTTIKTKPQSKQVQNRVSSNPRNGNEKPVQKKRPSEEQIRQKAQEIYYQRLNRGEHGTEIEDWQQAEKILTESE